MGLPAPVLLSSRQQKRVSKPAQLTKMWLCER
jgi:hypothetical protein